MRGAPDPDLIASVQAESAAAGDTEGARHLAEIEALALTEEQKAALALAVSAGIHFGAAAILSAEAAGGQAGMDLAARQIGEGLAEMARLCRRMEPGS